VAGANTLTIDRKGGFAGLKARAEIRFDQLSQADQSALKALFAAKRALPPSTGADRFTYEITGVIDGRARTIAVPEHLMPSGVAALVKDQLP